MQVFVATPKPPYQVGDLWTQGTSGSLYRCKNARPRGDFNQNDWELATSYDSKMDPEYTSDEYAWLFDKKNGIQLQANKNPVLTVTKDGLIMDGSGTFTGTITANAGKIGAWYLTSDGVLITRKKIDGVWYGIGLDARDLVWDLPNVAIFAAGSTLGKDDQPYYWQEAPFRITADGSLYATKGQIGGLSISDLSGRIDGAIGKNLLQGTSKTVQNKQYPAATFYTNTQEFTNDDWYTVSFVATAGQATG
jgi:hypothetical protein